MGLGWDEWDEAEYGMEGHTHPWRDTLAPGLTNGKVPGCPVCALRPDKVDYGRKVVLVGPVAESAIQVRASEMMKRIGRAARAERERMVAAILDESLNESKGGGR